MPAARGFCLAGGYAVQAHGILDRPSEDVDLFTVVPESFSTAVREAVARYGADGLVVTVLVESATYARLSVVEPASGASAKVELAVDWRAHPPTVLAVGPVLSQDDAVANKMAALLSRVAGTRLHRCRRSPRQRSVLPRRAAPPGS
ncbi:MAG: nucleotidyl transferase AbiEii/AbiGii toxin family protein [Dermatophilaceae bacterium]